MIKIKKTTVIVETFETSDGRSFGTRKEAETHEATTALRLIFNRVGSSNINQPITRTTAVSAVIKYFDEIQNILSPIFATEPTPEVSVAEAPKAKKTKEVPIKGKVKFPHAHYLNQLSRGAEIRPEQLEILKERNLIRWNTTEKRYDVSGPGKGYLTLWKSWKEKTAIKALANA